MCKRPRQLARALASHNKGGDTNKGQPCNDECESHAVVSEPRTEGVYTWFGERVGNQYFRKYHKPSDIFDQGTSMTWVLNLKIHRARELVQHLDLHVFINHQ